MIKKYGFAFAFYIYWVWYITILLIMIFQVEFDQRLIRSLSQLSFGFLGMSTMGILYVCQDDCRIRYTSACIFSFCLRMVLVFMTTWGFDDARLILLICGFSMVLFYLFKLDEKKSREEYFKY